MIAFLSSSYQQQNAIASKTLYISHLGPGTVRCHYDMVQCKMISLIARFMGPTWGPSGANMTQVGPMLAPWTLLCGIAHSIALIEAEHKSESKLTQETSYLALIGKLWSVYCQDLGADWLHCITKAISCCHKLSDKCIIACKSRLHCHWRNCLWFIYHFNEFLEGNH